MKSEARSKKGPRKQAATRARMGAWYTSFLVLIALGSALGFWLWEGGLRSASPEKGRGGSHGASEARPTAADTGAHRGPGFESQANDD